MDNTFSVTTIKAEPGYRLVMPKYPDRPGDRYLGVQYEPIVAWEIQRFSDEESTEVDIVAIGDHGTVSSKACPSSGFWIGIMRPDDTCYDYDNEFESVKAMLAHWNSLDRKRFGG